MSTTLVHDDLTNRIISIESNVLTMTKKLDEVIHIIHSLKRTPEEQSQSHKISNHKHRDPPSVREQPKFNPPALKTKKSLANTIFDKLEKTDSEREFSDIQETPSNRSSWTQPSKHGWIKLYCQKRSAHFYYNTITSKVIWETQPLEAKTKHGDNWEKVSYIDYKGNLQWLFLDPEHGEIESMEPVNKEAVVPKFDPGDYDPDYINSSSKKAFQNHDSFQNNNQKNNENISTSSPHQISSSSNHQSNKSIAERLHVVKHSNHFRHKRSAKLPGESWKFMFDPHDNKRLAWDFVFILPCLLYLTLVMPFRLCFMNEAQGSMLVLETSMDMVFILDILINFRTGYYVPELGYVEYNTRKVAHHYLTSWFLLDVVSGIPFALFDNVEALSNLSVLKIFKVGRVAKAARVVSFLKMTKVLKTTKVLSSNHEETLERMEDVMTDVTTRSALSILKIFGIIFVIVHFMACFWVFIGRMGDIEGRPNWLNNDVFIFNFSDDEIVEGFSHEDTTGGPKVISIYIAAYYFCYTTITSVGYGDIHPYNNAERIYCVLLEALGGFMYAIIIAALTSIATSTDTNKRAVRERLDMVSSYVNSKKFPDHLSRRIRRYFRHFFESKTAIDEQRILTDLPTGLRHEVSTYLISDLMSNVTLFKDLGPVSWSRILPLLRPCRFETGDLICSQGEDCTESFILLEGECRAITVVDPSVSSETFLIDNLSSPSSSSSPAMNHSKSNVAYSKISDNAPSALAALEKFAQEDNAHFRILKLGSMINVLCLLHVWEQCLETVVCTEDSECYTINSKEFRTIFTKDDETFKAMRERTVLTSFSMYQVSKEQSKESGLDYGVPLYMFQEAEVEYRNLAYLKWKKAKKEHFAQALRKYESDKAMSLALKRARALNRFARAFRSRSVGQPSLKIFPDILTQSQHKQSSDSAINGGGGGGEISFHEHQNDGEPLSAPLPTTNSADCYHRRVNSQDNKDSNNIDSESTTRAEMDAELREAQDVLNKTTTTQNVTVTNDPQRGSLSTSSMNGRNGELYNSQTNNEDSFLQNQKNRRLDRIPSSPDDLGTSTDLRKSGDDSGDSGGSGSGSDMTLTLLKKDSITLVPISSYSNNQYGGTQQQMGGGSMDSIQEEKLDASSSSRTTTSSEHQKAEDIKDSKILNNNSMNPNSWIKTKRKSENILQSFESDNGETKVESVNETTL